MKTITTYREFWPYYLAEHSQRGTQVLHTIGTAGGIVIGATLVLLGHLWGIGLGIVIGYGFAWYSHFFVQKNRPATFQYPLWSFISDFRMAYLVLTAQL